MMVFAIIIGAIGWLFAYFFDDISIAIFAVAFAAVYAFIQYFAADKVALATTGAKEIEKKDSPRLYNAVENISITTGLPMPKVYVIADPSPNAFATGRDPKHASVAATTGLLEIMNDEELTAVMAHEMGHVKNYDIRVSMIVFGLICAIGFLADIVSRILIRGSRGRSNSNGGGIITLVFGLAVAILAPIAAAIAQMAVSRQREYLADSTSAMITRYPEGMISALRKLQEFGKPMRNQNTATEALYINNPLKKGFMSKIFSTHPPIEDRIKKLEEAKGSF